MKELSIEEKVKAYDEALKRAKDMLSYKEVRREDMEYLFPELKESEDEKIRKAIVATIHLYYGEPLEDEAKEMIAWIEKQGEQILANSAKTCKDEQQLTDNDMKEALRTEYEKGRADAIVEMQKPVDCIDCTNSKDCINCEDGNMQETLVQKPAWTEADEKIGKDLIDFCIKCSQGDTVVNSQDDFAKWATWLKSLKERIGG